MSEERDEGRAGKGRLKDEHDPGRYSRISRRVWRDGRFRQLSAPEPCGQVLWLYLLTNPHLTSLPGLFAAREEGLAADLGWSLEAFREAFREVMAEGLVEADWEAGLVWVRKAVRHNPPASPNVVRSWGKSARELPECSLLGQAISSIREQLADFLENPDPYLKAFGEAFPEGFGEAFVEALPESRTGTGSRNKKQEELPTRASAHAGEPGSESSPGKVGGASGSHPGANSDRQTEAADANRGPSLPNGAANEAPADPAQPLGSNGAHKLTQAAGTDLDTEVYAHWRQLWAPRAAPALDDKRRKLIKARRAERLKGGASPAKVQDDLLRSLEGWKRDPWPDRPQHVKLEQLLRDAGQVDKGLELAGQVKRTARAKGDGPWVDASDCDHSGHPGGIVGDF